MLAFGQASAEDIKVSGTLGKDDVVVFLKDNKYIVNNQYKIDGTLIIEPGTEVHFHPNGRFVVGEGGRLIADGDASMTYTPRPVLASGQILDPREQLGPKNPNDYFGYADPAYFLYDGGFSSTLGLTATNTDLTVNEPTVHSSKDDYVYTVILDTVKRELMNYQVGTALAANQVKVSSTQAIMWMASRMDEYVGLNPDPNLNSYPWARIGDKPANIVNTEQIEFRGQPFNHSKEWGHIVVMPGARAAFFRNVHFHGFKKDTTVDRDDYFDVNNPPSSAWAAFNTTPNWRKINDDLRAASNGSGGVITTFSTRTWILGCNFNNNIARLRGGAVQFLEGPAGFPSSFSDEDDLIGTVGTYAANKNPNITNRDGSPSNRNDFKGLPGIVGIPAIDQIDNSTPEMITDLQRQAHDDARIAIYLGRVRNNSFDNNVARLVNSDLRNVGGGILIWGPLYDEKADFPFNAQASYVNGAFGGAIFIGSRFNSDDMTTSYSENKIEVGLGVNNSLMIDGALVEFEEKDTFVCTNNEAQNYQGHASTRGAKGGAIYVGDYTSLIVAGYFNTNQSYAKYFQDAEAGHSAGDFSQGGAIFMKNTLSRLQVRGGGDRKNYNNSTEFSNNKAGSGGAIFVDGNTDKTMSPFIGGSDALLTTRDYGYNILFQNNSAISYGGAIYTKRNMSINGAGGVAAGSMLGYGGEFPVRIWSNTAGYGGGGVNLDLPSATPLTNPEERNVLMIRASFRKNTVGEKITDDNRKDIRGGGAVYSNSADLNVVQGVEFLDNIAYNSNGGGIVMVHPLTSGKRYFISDLDNVTYNPQGVAVDFANVNGPFTYDTNFTFAANTDMLTRFSGNKTVVDQDILASESGSGETQVEDGKTFRTKETLMGTAWVDGETGYAVGSKGAIVKLTNSGSIWTNQTSPRVTQLNSVHVIGVNTAVIVGNEGAIIKTTNAGSTWMDKSTIDNRNINSVYFTGTTNGFAAADGGYLYSTMDGGDTWMSTEIQAGRDLNSINFVSTNTGFIAGDRGTILKTENGGATWNVLSTGTFDDLYAVAFKDAMKGIAVGQNGTIISTTNGGSSWTDVTPAINTRGLNGVHINSDESVFAVGNNATIMKSIDFGDTWAAQTSSATDNNSLYSVFFRNKNKGYAVGNGGFVEKTEDGGATWVSVVPADQAHVDVTRMHQGTSLPENGVGLGGAMYLLDSVTVNRNLRTDSLRFNRVRMQNNEAYSGAAIYSDNYNLKLIFNRSLVTGNVATSNIGEEQNMISGPLRRDSNGDIEYNAASSDLAGAVIYGEVQGPLPSWRYSEAANSFFDNSGRFLIRLPDAPNSKGLLTGTVGIGDGGTDTLRGNYWGRTEAPVQLEIANIVDDNVTYVLPNSKPYTFFVQGDGGMHLPFKYNPSNPKEQGPFEQILKYTYTPVPLANEAGNQNMSASYSIPEKLLMSGHIYDIYDKGTDIKTADYSKRRMSPIEDFAVGIPSVIKTYSNTDWSNGRYVKRMIRDPYCLDDAKYSALFATLQKEYQPKIEWNTSTNEFDTTFYHPIGQPLYLETEVDYTGKLSESNDDPTTVNESVFFVINEITTDFVRLSMKQVSEDAPYRETFRGKLDFVPDSSDRIDPTIRRTTEGLSNIGVEFLYDALRFNPYTEDKAALQGRKYTAPKNRLGNIPNIFSNRPDLPTDNGGMATYFAGERYNTLPVRKDDIVRVISRTVLWKEGAKNAFEKGISFKISESVEKPEFTGDVVKLNTDTIWVEKPSELPERRDLGLVDTVPLVDFLDRVFITEDRTYPQPEGTYNDEDEMDRGVDSILTVTAKDINNYYDPRGHFDPDKYTDLTYVWEVANNSGLKNWLLVDTVYAQTNGTDNIRDEARGYFVFKGKPVNPYVVPGGETVTVSALSYPPHYRTIDSLKATYGWANDNDTLAKLIELYPDYFHAQSYDDADARFLQQDTIDIATNEGYRVDYNFEIFVTDSVPRWLDWNETSQTLTRNDSEGNVIDVIVEYSPSLRVCGETGDEDGNRLIATLTDKLRFQVDINTDDELEDAWAEKVHGWHFNYGRTAYGFKNRYQITKDKDGNDEIVVDDEIIVYDEETEESSTYFNQVRPSWMSDQYLMKYDTDDEQDLFGGDFMTNGQINIRLDSSIAYSLLKPRVQFNGKYDTDTTFALVVNDGHGGKLEQGFDVFVNIAPTIKTETIAIAKEDWRYDDQLIDSLDDINDDYNDRIIKGFDPNYGQSVRYAIIKEGNEDFTDGTNNGILKDPCFPEAGYWTRDTDYDLNSPEWLFINDSSGVLYGTPGINDAPLTSLVSILVTDEHGLTFVKQFNLQVDSTSHPTTIVEVPEVICVDMGADYTDTIVIKDPDFLRKIDGYTELINIGVSPSGLTATPSVIDGSDVTITNDEVKVVISGKFEDVNEDGIAVVTITGTDSQGNVVVVKTYEVQVSEATDFVCDIKVENSFGHQQILEWGIAGQNTEATTGDGRDGKDKGSIDAKLCERELPRLPYDPVFDVRWHIDLTEGILRSIFPRNATVNNNYFEYFAKIRPGGEDGAVSSYFPLKISWKTDCVPGLDDPRNDTKSTFFLRDAYSSGGQLFTVNMTRDEWKGSEVIEHIGDNTVITVSNPLVRGFIIYYDYKTDVESGMLEVTSTDIKMVYPNPVKNETDITFDIDKASDVRLEVLDIFGSVVATINSDYYRPGTHTIGWSGVKATGERVAAGSYTVRLTAGSDVSTYPIVVVD